MWYHHNYFLILNTRGRVLMKLKFALVVNNQEITKNCNN